MPRSHRFARPAASLLAVASLVGCSFLVRNTDPRPDDPNAKAPTRPAAAVTWSSLEWQETTFDQPPKDSPEQWDQATAVAAGPGGWVAVGSNSDISGYEGRIWHSDDSIAWTLVGGDVVDGVELVDIAGTPEAFVAIGTNSASINDPIASIFRSIDGMTWEEVERIDGAWSDTVAAGPIGFAAVLQVGDWTDLLFSSDGTDWNRIRGVDIDADIEAPVWVADVAWERDGERDGWVAVGRAGNRAVVLRSQDGARWVEDPLPGSEPVEGLQDMSAYSVVPGRWATLLLGVARAPNCLEDDEWCDKHQTGWSWTAETGWQRLPKATWVLNQGFGIQTYAAGDAGFVTFATEIRISADGWAWEPVGDGSPVRGIVMDAVTHDDRVVAVGWPVDEAPELVGWFGSAIIRG